MKRVLLLGFIVSFVGAPVWAQEDKYKEGVNYEVLKQPQPVQTGDKIEVLEMFWYRCPHCYNLEPYVHRWLESKPDNAEYVAYPAILGQSWVFHARAFFTFEALGALDKLHASFFDAIHKEKRKFGGAEDLADWAAGQGQDKQAVLDAFKSFAVDTKTRHAGLLSGKYLVTGVPAIIVDGKYKTSARLAGGNAELFELVNYLVEKSQGERVN